jgi:hypothetical protein
LKVTDNKSTTATIQRKSEPFFRKEGDQDFFSRKPNDNSFFSPAKSSKLQAKLTIGQPGDKYEQEADATADKVVQRLATPDKQHREQGIQRKPLSAGITPLVQHASNQSITPSPIQAKCEACEQEEKLQKKEEKKDEEGLKEKLQRKPIFDSDAEPPDDKTVQRKCAACEEEEKKVQKKEAGSSGEYASSSIESHLNSSRGSGSSLPESTRNNMESAFGVDFSNVRIHNDSNSVSMNKEVNAQAFTYGSDIYFNEGKYQPNTLEGQHLLAHEMTHVVQQSPSIEKKADKGNANQTIEIGVHGSSEEKLQRSKSFIPTTGAGGTAIHNRVLPPFLKTNKDLFIEVKIPSGNKSGVELGSKGIADFYKANPQHRTIGLNFSEGEPSFLTQSSNLDYGGGPYNHKTGSAPQGTVSTPKIKQINNAPSGIELGDLKPGGSAEVLLGNNQLSNYKKGIEVTASEANKYLQNNPKETDGVSSWHPNVTKINNLTIPPELTYPGKGIIRGQLAVRDLTGTIVKDSGLVGSLFVYKDKEAGIWSYEWIPEDVNTPSGNAKVNEVLKRLNKDVIPPLVAVAAEKKISPKRSPVQVVSTTRNIQRKEGGFKDEDWKKKYYSPWKDDAKKFLGDKKEVDKAQVAGALADLKERSNGLVPVPDEVVERGKGLDKIKHWSRLGALYGWLREKFDFIYVKISAFAKKIKDKIQKLAKKAGSTSFGSWVKATAKVVFKIFKMVGSWVVGQVLDKLVNSLQEGIVNNFKKLVEDITPEEVKSKVEQFEELKEKYNQILQEQEDALIKRFFGDKLEFFEKLEEFEKIADTFSTIATIVEWGVRLLACASPPAVGCLWNLLLSALQAAFALLIQTCWFSKKVYEPIISKVDIVKNFPTEIASKIVTEANEQIPVPNGFEPIFAPININAREFKMDCDESGDGPGKLSPERSAIMDLIDEIGSDKFNALLELSIQRGAGPWVLLTAERLAELKKSLKDVSTEELLKAARDKSSGTPQPLDNFIKDIKGYSPAEKGLIAESKKGKKGEGGQSIDPTYGKPQKITGHVTANYGTIVKAKKFEKGQLIKDTILAYYFIVVFKDGESVFNLQFRNVSFKVVSVEDNSVVFENVKDFYGNYSGDKSVFFEMGKHITITNDMIKYEQ